MRIVRFEQDGKPSAHGILEADDKLVPLEGDIFGEWSLTDKQLALDDVRLLAPVQPPNILAVGFNYHGHAVEYGAEIPTAPVLFIKASTAVIGPGDPVALPRMAPDEVDFEAELVIVIGKNTRQVSASAAQEYVLGYTCGNDISARDCQLRIDAQWARGKSFDTFAPLGPWIETDLDAASAPIRSRLNGEVMQDSNTSDLIFAANYLVSYLSQCMTLLAGTVIFTGTPSGVGFAQDPPVYLKPGDVMEVEVEGIGKLVNPVISETS